MPQVEQVNPEAVTMEPQPQAQPQQIEAVVTGIQDGLIILRELMEKTPGIMPEDKSRLNNIISEYRGLITENLSAAPGEGQAPKPVPGQAPVEAGARAVQQA